MHIELVCKQYSNENTVDIYVDIVVIFIIFGLLIVEI